MENKTLLETDMLPDNKNFSSNVDDKIIQSLTNFLVPVAFGIILTVGLVGNLLVIIVVRSGYISHTNLILPSSHPHSMLKWRKTDFFEICLNK